MTVQAGTLLSKLPQLLGLVDAQDQSIASRVKAQNAWLATKLQQEDLPLPSGAPQQVQLTRMSTLNCCLGLQINCGHWAKRGLQCGLVCCRQQSPLQPRERAGADGHARLPYQWSKRTQRMSRAAQQLSQRMHNREIQV